MTSEPLPGNETPNAPLARQVTDWLAPRTWIIAVSLLVGWKTADWSGVAWGAFGALFTAVLPMLFITYGVKRGHWGDKHVGARTARLIVMPAVLASVLLGIGLMAVLHAPRAMIALVATMLITLAALTAVTLVWKISVHQSVSAGACAVLIQVYGPWMLLGYALVVLVGWSRIELGDHTRNQVIAGTLLGTLVAAATFALLR